MIYIFIGCFIELVWETIVRDSGNHKRDDSKGTIIILILFNQLTKTKAIERGVNHW